MRLQSLFEIDPVLAGQTGVVRKEFHRQTRILRHRPQLVRIPFDALSRPRKDQIPAPAQLGEQVLGHCASGGGFVLTFLVTSASVPLFEIASELDLELLAIRLAFQQHHRVGGFRAEVFPRQRHLPQRCGEADPPDSASDRQFQPGEERAQVDAALIVQQRVQLIDDDRACAGEQ